MLRRTLTCLVLVILTSAGAIGATYYVDPVGGDDSNKGTSKGNPWKTLAKVSSTSFGAGDKVHFKRNCQFRGTLALHGSGTSARPVTIDAYGKGNKHCNYAALESNNTNLDSSPLKPAQKVDAFTLIEVPAKAQIHKLIVEPY